ncbi:ECF transporter S component [Microbacterium aquimaris]|uniref:ECF transporter S component n=1 Tax=Microbacterium aquimaris TaxID=459816 RepID=A0ABU5N3R7_9MICO|nr:ECF transporter S component [Microbacterium aquimaris]MDZ8160557.1 hypothetical protein [Microbacterium aquimaris]
MTDEEGGSARRAPFDEIAGDLQRLRIESGDASYAEIAIRIARRREADGASPASARIARSTVYDVFRTGRRRINADLVAEIVTALGGDDETAAAWRRRCLAVRVDAAQIATGSEPDAISSSPSDPGDHRGRQPSREPDDARAEEDTVDARAGAAGTGYGSPLADADPEGSDDLRSGMHPDAASRSAEGGTRRTRRPAGTPSSSPPDASGRDRAVDADGPSVATLRASLVVAIMVGSVLLNLFGTAVHQALSLPLFLDMIGTATTAFVLGPWYGVIVGLTTNALGAIVTSPETVVFGLVSATGAVLWGYGIRGFARTIPRFILLNMLVALACTLVAVPLNGFLYDGDSSGHATDAYVNALRTAQGMWLALFSVNFLASLIDKMIAGSLALALARLLTPLRLREGAPPTLLQSRRGRRGA